MKKTIVDYKTKLNAIEALTTLLKGWDNNAKSVILFITPKLRFKATRRKGQNEILITFGRPNYQEKAYYKKFVIRTKGRAPKILVKF